MFTYKYHKLTKRIVIAVINDAGSMQNIYSMIIEKMMKYSKK